MSQAKAVTPARYCPKCGAKTVLYNCEEEFDPDTGEKIVFVKVLCPKRAFWNSNHYVERSPFVYAPKRRVDSPELFWWTQGEGSK